MFIKRSFIVVFGLLSMTVSSLNAQQTEVVPSSLPAPEIDATAWVLMEMNSGAVVTGHNAELPLPPASITKLMMNYVVFERLRDGDVALSDQVPISEKAWRAEGSRICLLYTSDAADDW